MYTDSKIYQIIIALLKKYGIKHCVLSAGSRNVPFVHSVEEDPYFKCYSVVDERSAGYFALGIAQQLQEPVVISCTSSTATCNYWPAVAEAYYQNVPLVVLTSDRNPHMLGQWEDQMIDQVGMYDRHVKKSVNLPEQADTKDDFIYCQRLVNEALSELNHHGTGPVHINIPMKGYNMAFYTHKLPEVQKVDRVYINDSFCWESKIERLRNAKSVLVICGQRNYISEKLNSGLQQFFEQYNCAISAEYMANVQGDNIINTSVAMETRLITQDKFKEFIPEIVISYGGNIMQGVKSMLRENAGSFEHWQIEPDGRIVDTYKSISTVFECTAEEFFERCCQAAGQKTVNDKIYYDKIRKYCDSIEYPEFPYSSVYAIKNVVERIPAGSVLHLSINNAIRVTNFFKLNKNIRTYANIGTYGIDGCLSSFLGQSICTNSNCYLIIGDLSFLYDMNALRIKHIGNNVRILLINNQGGAEFYYNGSVINESSDLHTTARHHDTAGAWAKSVGFKYLTANDLETYDAALSQFMTDDSDAPILFEVFTEMGNDSSIIHRFYSQNKEDTWKETIVQGIKSGIKKTFGGDNAKKLKSILKNN